MRDALYKADLLKGSVIVNAPAALRPAAGAALAGPTERRADYSNSFARQSSDRPRGWGLTRHAGRDTAHSGKLGAHCVHLLFYRRSFLGCFIRNRLPIRSYRRRRFDCWRRHSRTRWTFGGGRFDCWRRSCGFLRRGMCTSNRFGADGARCRCLRQVWLPSPGGS